MLLALIGLSIAYIWQPWNPGQSSLKLGLDLQGGLRVVLQADGVVPDAEDLNSARNIIENRVNEFGVSEPLVQTSGSNRIMVEFPGLSSSEQDRALDLIGQQAVLEFRLVRPGAVDPLTLDDLEPAAFTGEIIRTASADFNRSPGMAMGPMVTFEIRSQDANAFGNFTGGNLGRRMAIVLDDRIVTAPSLNGRISDTGQITGMAGLEEATDVALVLRSGSLPFNLNVEEIRTIGPTLGQDSIDSSILAGTIGAAAVFVAVLVFYGPLFGGALVMGLLLAVLFIFGILAGLGAALTLPGLAGLVLTFGAAVDGNVISFERVREYLREGKSLRVSMKRGFEMSKAPIIDANLTSLLAALALYQYTTGPVRGFAVILAVGIIVSVFVNIVIVPFIVDLLTMRTSRPLMSFGRPAPKIPFLSLARVAVSITVIAVLASAVLLLARPMNLSTDFSGGTNVTYQLPADATVADVRAALDELAGANAASASIVQIDDPAGNNLMSVRIGPGADGEIDGALPSTLALALEADVLSADVVGPSVGADLRSGAIKSVLLALALILAYTAWRFWPNWILGAATTAATAHDTLIVLALLNLIGAEFSIPVLAALLFVVGYSLNDSIIISDRIRENISTTRGASYAELVNLSINQTLSRTILTSGTTLLPVIALLVWGGPVLRDFSITLLAGVIIGTFSSIFILGPILVWFRNRQALAVPGKAQQASKAKAA
jgi:SecD/SecF fusion protein